MSLSKLSDSSQNYFKAVWGLSEWSDTPVTASTIAQRVGVKLSSASDAVRKLTAQGLLEHNPYGDVQLSAEGLKLALEVVRRHRLIETFLVTTLGYTWDQVHDEAENLEHSISDFMTDRIDALLGYPTRDPHGDPIPSADGQITIPRAIPLVDLPAGESARVERISDDDPALLQFFAERNIAFGSGIIRHASAPFSDTIDIALADTPDTLISLGVSAAQALWVSPPELATESAEEQGASAAG